MLQNNIPVENNNKSNKFTNTILIVISVCGVITYHAFAWGFVFYKFYYWFVLPVFNNLPVINFHQAIGLAFFTTLFKNNFTLVNKPEFRDDNILPYIHFFAPILIFNVGYIIYAFFVK